MDPITAIIVNIIIGIILSTASTLIKQAFEQDKKTPVAGVRGTKQVGGDNPLAFIMGFYGTAGQFEYGGEWGEVNETPNAFHTEVISLSDVPVKGVVNYYVNGQKVTLSGVAATQGFPVLEYRVDGVDHLWIKVYTGVQTTSDTFLVSRFGTHPVRPWTTAHIGRGVAYAVTTALFNREVFTSIPEWMFEIEGILLYDPRKDTTVGGSGAHRLATPGTWEYSDNPVVAIYNILLGLNYGTEWVFGPQNIAQARLPYAKWSAEMTKCDALVAKAGGGTEKRFRFGLEIAGEETHAVIGELLKACNGRIAEIGGIYKILVGEAGAAVKAITDEDLVITDRRLLDPFPGLEGTFNAIVATYPDPDEGWEYKDAPPRYSASLETADDGRRLPFSTSFKAVPFARQVQRLMLAAIQEVRRFRRPTFTTPTEWWEYEPLDVFSWTSTQEGFTAKLFLITVMDDLPNGDLIVGSQEIDPLDYDWNSTFELPWDITPIVVSGTASQPMVGWQVIADYFTDSSGLARRPSMRVSYSGGLVDVRSIRVQVRLVSTLATVFDGEHPYDKSVVTPSLILNGTFLPSTAYEARGKFVPRGRRKTDWSAWLAVTTPAVFLDDRDLSTTYNSAIAFTRDTAATVKADFAAFINEFTALPLSEYVKRSQLIIDLATNLGAAEAKAAELVALATGPASALFGRSSVLEGRLNSLGGQSYENYIASLQTTIGRLNALNDQVTAEVTRTDIIEAQAGGASASGAFKMQVGAGASSAFVRLSAMGRTTDPSYAHRNVGWYAEIPVNPLLPTKFVILADNTYLFDSAGAIVALFKRDAAGKTKLNGAYIPKLTVDQLDVNSLASFFSDVIVQGNLIIRGNVTAANIPLGALTGSISNTIPTNVSGPARGAQKLLATVTATPNGGQIDISAQCFAFNPSKVRGWFKIMRGTRLITGAEIIIGNVNINEAPSAHVTLLATDKTSIGVSPIKYDFYITGRNPYGLETTTLTNVTIRNRYLNAAWRNR